MDWLGSPNIDCNKYNFYSVRLYYKMSDEKKHVYRILYILNPQKLIAFAQMHIIIAIECRRYKSYSGNSITTEWVWMKIESCIEILTSNLIPKNKVNNNAT